MLNTDPSDHLNESVVLVGVAQNAKSGAVVLLSYGKSVYISDLDHWDAQWSGKRIRVTGLLRKKKLAPDPEMNSGDIAAGMSGMSLVLEKAKWERV